MEVELPDSNITESVEVTGKTALGISRLRTIKIPNVWGTMKFHATGAGQVGIRAVNRPSPFTRRSRLISFLLVESAY